MQATEQRIDPPDVEWWELADYYRAIDAGEVCPKCDRHEQAKRITALGVALWECPRCNETWFDVSDEVAK